MQESGLVSLRVVFDVKELSELFDYFSPGLEISVQTGLRIGVATFFAITSHEVLSCPFGFPVVVPVWATRRHFVFPNFEVGVEEQNQGRVVEKPDLSFRFGSRRFFWKV